MGKSEFYRPLIYLWRGRIYFVIAVLTFALAKLLALLIVSVSSTFSSQLQADLKHVADFLSEGVPYFALLLILAGFLVGILTEVSEGVWIGGLKQATVDGFVEIAKAVAVGVSDLKTDLKTSVILPWLKNIANQADRKEIGLAALKFYYGSHNDVADNYIDYVLHNFLDKSAIPTGFSRKNLVSTINIRKTQFKTGGTSGEDIFEWRETKAFHLVCPAGKGEHPLRFHTSSRVSAADVRQILDKVQVTISVGGDEIFNFEKWRVAFDVEKWFGEESPPITDNGLILNFDGVYLSLDLEKDIPICTVETRITTFEQSYIMESERWYTLSMDQPTFNMDFTVQLERDLEGWSIKRPTVSVSAYHSDAKAFVTIRQPVQSILNVHVPQWTLPGVTFVVEWAPPQ